MVQRRGTGHQLGIRRAAKAHRPIREDEDQRVEFVTALVKGGGAAVVSPDLALLVELPSDFSSRESEWRKCPKKSIIAPVRAASVEPAWPSSVFWAGAAADDSCSCSYAQATIVAPSTTRTSPMRRASLMLGRAVDGWAIFFFFSIWDSPNWNDSPIWNDPALILQKFLSGLLQLILFSKGGESERLLLCAGLTDDIGFSNKGHIYILRSFSSLSFRISVEF